MSSATLIEWTDTLLRALEGRIEIAAKASLLRLAARFAISEVERVLRTSI